MEVGQYVLIQEKTLGLVCKKPKIYENNADNFVLIDDLVGLKSYGFYSDDQLTAITKEVAEIIAKANNRDLLGLHEQIFNME